LPRNIGERLVDTEQSYRWLKYGDIKGETGNIKQLGQLYTKEISTNYINNKILKEQTTLNACYVNNIKKLSTT
jgi:hypothetical protein